MEMVTFRRDGTGEVLPLLCSCAASPAQSAPIPARSTIGSVQESCLFSRQKPLTRRRGVKPPSLTGTESDSGGDQWWQEVVEARAMRQPLDRVQAVSAAIPRGSRSPCSTSPPSCSDGHQVANAVAASPQMIMPRSSQRARRHSATVVRLEYSSRWSILAL